MYRPSNLTVVIVGDVDANGALALVRHHLEGIAEPAQPLPPAVAFAGLPAKREMAWDGSVRAVCLCWEPPTAAADRVSLALLGGELQRALSNDAAVAGATDCVFASNWIWGVGELPFFVYATASGSTTLPELEALLRGKVQAFLGAANVRPKQNALSAAALLGRIDQITSKYVELMASRFRRPGQGDTEGVRMVLGQSALNWDVSVRRVGRNGIRDLQQLSQEEAQRVLVPLTPERCKVTYLIPE